MWLSLLAFFNFFLLVVQFFCKTSRVLFEYVSFALVCHASGVDSSAKRSSHILFLLLLSFSLSSSLLSSLLLCFEWLIWGIVNCNSVCFPQGIFFTTGFFDWGCSSSRKISDLFSGERPNRVRKKSTPLLLLFVVDVKEGVASLFWSSPAIVSSSSSSSSSSSLSLSSQLSLLSLSSLSSSSSSSCSFSLSSSIRLLVLAFFRIMPNRSPIAFWLPISES
mmetsp:Transcript_25377/g.55614  ORF Transcript_25377/g.55614 Transcript_25377/m.55614 type:complete len:220 (-) Transcript_25377:201-860(-)